MHAEMNLYTYKIFPIESMRILHHRSFYHKPVVFVFSIRFTYINRTEIFLFRNTMDSPFMHIAHVDIEYNNTKIEFEINHDFLCFVNAGKMKSQIQILFFTRSQQKRDE